MLGLTSKFLHTGKVGRPPLEETNTTTINVGPIQIGQVHDFCIENGVKMRELFELATEQVLINGDSFAKYIRKQRAQGMLKSPPGSRKVFVEMNNRAWGVMVDFCIDHDVSQREFFLCAVKMLLFTKDFKRKMHAQRVAKEQQRAQALLESRK